jgi:hypothetical protein
LNIPRSRERKPSFSQQLEQEVLQSVQGEPPQAELVPPAHMLNSNKAVFMQ